MVERYGKMNMFAKGETGAKIARQDNDFEVSNDYLQIAQIEKEMCVLQNQIMKMEEMRKEVLTNITHKGFSICVEKMKATRELSDGDLHQVTLRDHEKILDIFKKIDCYIESNQNIPELSKF